MSSSTPHIILSENEGVVDTTTVLKTDPGITVCMPEGQRLNGLGMMVLQYLEQNFAQFDHKVKEGLRIRGRVAVEVEKGIAITLWFQGERVQIENGVSEDQDLYIKSSYVLLSKVLSGKSNPYVEILRGNIKLLALPRRPVQGLRVLRFLKIPPELLLEPLPSRRKQYVLYVIGTILGMAGMSLLIYQLYHLFGN